LFERSLGSFDLNLNTSMSQSEGQVMVKQNLHSRETLRI